jgi:hypothetical protein
MRLLRDRRYQALEMVDEGIDLSAIASGNIAANNQTVRQCLIREEPAGLLINASTLQPFTYKDSCVELNPHVGYDAAATEAAKTSIKDFLKTVFKL